MGWLTSAWRNPFPVDACRDKQAVLDQFRAWGECQPWLIDAVKRELPGKKLTWDTPGTWHGEVLQSWINDPLPRWIFVFGSNLVGRHGAGAARDAVRLHGAKPGVGQGLQGNSWALPTKDAHLQPLPLTAIQEEALSLTHYANFAPNYHFQLTRVGCGLSGYSDQQIAPLFTDPPANLHLPGRWLSIAHPGALPRVVVCGSRGIASTATVFSLLDRLRERLGDFEVVSGGADGVDRLGEDYAVTQGLPFVRFPALWNTHGKQAGYLRNATMISWYGTHVVAIWDGSSRGTKHSISLARQEEIPLWVPRTDPYLLAEHHGSATMPIKR